MSFLIFHRSNVLTIKEHYQYPKLEGEGTEETDVFSREPFIVRFHSPTTCTTKHLWKESRHMSKHYYLSQDLRPFSQRYTIFSWVLKTWMVCGYCHLIQVGG